MTARRTVAALPLLALAAVLLKIVNVLLLRQLLAAPAAFGGWLALAFVLYLFVRALLFPGDGSARRGLLDLVMPAFLVALVFVFHYGFLDVISDARDYFIQVRSIVIDGDLAIPPNEVLGYGGRGAAPFYPVGSALLWAPFYGACHLWLGLLNVLGADYVRDGYEAPYRVAVGLGTLLYGYAALLMIARLLRQYFSPPVAVWTTVAVCCGSFLLWYLTIESAMSHGTSLFSVTLFLYVWHQTRQRRTLGQWVGLGAAVGLMTLVRWQNSLFAIVVGLEAVEHYWRAWRGTSESRIPQLLGRHLAGAAAAAVVFLPQFWLWRLNWGGWFAAPGELYGLDWFNINPADVLFSPNHGLVSWSPVIYLSLLGLLLFIGRQPKLGATLTVAFLGQLYANSIVQVWWGGSAFGARKFAGCALIFALGLASLLEWCRARPSVAIGTVLVSVVSVNLFLMSAVRQGTLPSGQGLTAPQMLGPAYDRVGNPFSLPASLVFAMTHGVSPQRYDELGRQLYGAIRIDIGEPDDAPFLTYGWSDRERDSRFSFRWAVGPEAGLVAPIRTRFDYLLRFDAEPFTYPGAERLSMDVVVNGDLVAQIGLDPPVATYTVPIPRRSVRPNLNHVKFRFSAATSPSSVGLSDDTRQLTVLFDRIELVPVLKETPIASSRD